MRSSTDILIKLSFTTLAQVHILTEKMSIIYKRLGKIMLEKHRQVLRYDHAFRFLLCSLCVYDYNLQY